MLATHRQDTIDAWLDEPDPTAPRDDDPVWSAEAEMAAFAQLQAAAL